MASLKEIVAVLGLVLFISSHCRSQALLVDQLGYRPGDPKMAFAQGLIRGSFEVKDVTTNASVFGGTIKSIGTRDANTGDYLFALDFSTLKSPGSYRIWVSGADVVSPEFRIDANVYNSAAISSLQSFYYQRCGVGIENGSIWQHPACHTNDAAFFHTPASSKNVIGGWHDAGDYNKFVPTTAISAAFLLYLYDHQPENFFDSQLSIPESGNGVPDILDEGRWALEWLLKMQRDDGAVYHKVSIKTWTGEHLPQEETDQRFIFDVSSTSTGDFAAVAALGARLFKKWDPQFARLLLKASKDAWSFLERHEDIVPAGGFRNPPGVEGGEYEDQNDLDERLWASVELYRLTGSGGYQDYFAGHYQQRGVYQNPVSWQEVQNFAYASYLRVRELPVRQNVRADLLTNLERYAEELLKRIEDSGYRYVLKPDEYYWGSNSIALGYTFDLIQGFELTKRFRYRDAALHQLHYILGRNPFNLCFMTGAGSNSVVHPYHQFSLMLRAGKPVPGLVVGGANKTSKLGGKKLSDFAGRCYEDNEKNYFVNETAINYTAPLVYVAGYFSRFKKPPHDTLTANGRR